MYIRECMKSPVITITPDEPIRMAQTLMRDNRIHRLPVVYETGRLMGLLTEARLRQAIASRGSAATADKMPQSLSAIRVRDVMITDVITISPNAHVDRAAKMGRKHGVGVLPVVDESGQVIGIITASDLVKLLEDIMRPAKNGGTLYFTGESDQQKLPEIINLLNAHQARIITVMKVPPPRSSREQLSIHITADDMAAVVNTLIKHGYDCTVSLDEA